MVRYPYPQPVDKTLFRSPQPDQALYGLPLEVKFCRSCVISNQRPSSTAEFKNDGKAPKQAIHFDKEGICDACRVKEQKAAIDWRQREEELRDLCDRYRRNDGRYEHSFVANNVDSSHVMHYCEYAGNRFVASVRDRSVVGFQFHPERSGSEGMSLLADICNDLLRK